MRYTEVDISGFVVGCAKIVTGPRPKRWQSYRQSLGEQSARLGERQAMIVLEEDHRLDHPDFAVAESWLRRCSSARSSTLSTNGSDALSRSLLGMLPVLPGTISRARRAWMKSLNSASLNVTSRPEFG